MNIVFESVGVGADGNLWHTIRNPDGTWQPSFGLVESQASGGPSGFQAVSLAGVGQDAQLVGMGTDQRLWHTIRYYNGSWQPAFGLVEGETAGGPSGFIGVGCAGIGSALEVVGVGNDNKLWWTFRNPDGTWQSTFLAVPSSGGPSGGFTAVGCAAVGGPFGGSLLAVVGLGTDGQLWLTTCDVVDADWASSYLSVASVSSGGPSAYTSVCCGGVDSTLEIVGVGNDNNLWHTLRDGSGNWQSRFWTIESESAGGPAGFSAVGCAGVAGVLDVVGVGTDDQLWHTIRNSDGSWQPNFGLVEGVSQGGPTHGFVAASGASGLDATATWLLGFTSSDPNSPAGDGRPWGDGTAMAARARAGSLPWDSGNSVVPMVGGFLAMNAMCNAFESAISDAAGQAGRGVPPGQRGYVYIADWQFNALRDLSTGNPWGNSPWNPSVTVAKDQTALGFVIRMMAAGITVRVLLWMPTTVQRQSMTNLADEHWTVAAAVQDYNTTLQSQWNLGQPIGVVALDLRTAAPLAAALHQKMTVVRVGAVNVAFCGGVDLAFTRRDFGLSGTQSIGQGDWQSGNTVPLSGKGWPKQNPPPTGGYPNYPYPGSPLLNDGQFPEDLPANVYAASTGNKYRHWHDHHLQLQGPVVAALEQQFAERWIMDTTGRVYTFDRTSSIGYDNQVQLTSSACILNNKVLPLPPAPPATPAGTSTVQMWRTIPLRPGISVGPFVRGEFTVMAGVANAVKQATQLITIWDQYFWSEPLARLLAAQLMANPGLLLLIVLPPYGTTQPAMELMLRKNALQDLWNGLNAGGRNRVLALDMWSQTDNIGVYVHAKVQTYDDVLLVCGSANMNRRSTQCDAELDCAVLDQTVVETHLSNLYACLTGNTWSDFSTGWLARIWSAMGANSGRALIRDPFFTATIGNPTTPNGVPMPYSSSWPVSLFEPTSIGPNVEGNVCQFPACSGDPKAAGRLDEVTFLLERCYQGTSWPWRQPATSVAFEEAEAVGMPRLTL